MTTRKELLRTIRRHCLNCCSDSYVDVETCPAGEKTGGFARCELHRFRFGRDPDEPSEAMREKGRKAAMKLWADHKQPHEICKS